MSVLSILKFPTFIRNAYGIRRLATTIHVDELHQPVKKTKLRGDYVPVYVALGLILFGASLGLHTAGLQIAYSPNVFVDKKKRETVPEVVAPDWSLEEAERFIDKSVLRKVAYLQDFDAIHAGFPDPTRRRAIHALPKKAETLKDVGIDLPGFQTKGSRLRELLGGLIGKKQQ